MDAKTLEALKASIAKWERNAEAVDPSEVRLGSDECPLCALFNQGTYISQFCRGCPVFDKTGEKFCHQTPYSSAVHASHWSTEEGRMAWVNAARDEVAFLKSLLPEATP